jgi:RNA polymerase sigma-70 factor (TIGR02960 family)
VQRREQQMTDAILSRAREGDEQAFRDLTDPYRRELHLHCYRILSSLADADDMLQETLLAAWRGLEKFESRSSLRAWLYRIATNRCLNALRDAKRRPPPALLPPFEPPPATRHGEPSRLQPYPDALLEQMIDAEPGPEARTQIRETIELAFVSWLQQMPPRQAATLILRDVLGFSTAEVAVMLNTTDTTVKGALQRARATIEQRRREQKHERRPAPGSAAERKISRSFAEAFAADDIDGVVALLTDDVWLTMPPASHQYQGGQAVASFLHASRRWRDARRFRLVATAANLQPAYGFYLPTEQGSDACAEGIMVLNVRGGRIDRITRFVDRDLPARFGLPSSIPLPSSPAVLR